MVRTFSKFLGMCGFRLGYIISSKKNTDGFLNERIPYSTSSLATELMVNLLTNHKQALYETVQRVIQGKAYFESQIPCIPTYGNYSLAKMLPVRFKLLASYKEVMGLFRVSSGSEEVMKEVLMACKEPVE
ncbi:MAG: aminotransferase class I/II-fold pyridoxal phosphate-dependent enzyme [Actinobacteria bacterium]|nr:aminotransferase class I/II-fold pyridoxal phosphate-dependent enzyme [Actinomycetota bacterium]NBO56100.1 aminotransferase class I/II-fold pyridoxal phosphate-dependent enzyme [Actinomycetota bacterium]